MFRKVVNGEWGQLSEEKFKKIETDVLTMDQNAPWLFVIDNEKECRYALGSPDVESPDWDKFTYDTYDFDKQRLIGFKEENNGKHYSMKEVLMAKKLEELGNW